MKVVHGARTYNLVPKCHIEVLYIVLALFEHLRGSFLQRDELLFFSALPSDQRYFWLLNDFFFAGHIATALASHSRIYAVSFTRR